MITLPGFIPSTNVPRSVLFFSAPAASPGGSYASDSLSYERAVKTAAARGLEIVLPANNELFIDIDSDADFRVFNEQKKVLAQTETILREEVRYSASGPPHRHIVLVLKRELSPMMRIALQASLGSDRKRELLSMQRACAGNPHPTLFFERPAGAPKPEVQTGFNCRQCNSRNDYAHANQPDGTYVCFECRIS